MEKKTFTVYEAYLEKRLITLALEVEAATKEEALELYDAGIASMEGGGSYNQDDAEGFLRIQGLPLRVQGRIRPREL